jgi:glycosyltransferase involved in cell wall biosynthesis
MSHRERTAGLVSVVIPAFNAAKSLARAVDSALGQTYGHLEVIVVNDGSQDQTEAVARGYGERIRYIAQENRGETAARNSGFALAGGEFVTFVDHDDYWEPTFVEKTVRFLVEHPDVAAVSVGQSCRNALKEGVTIRPACLAAVRSTGFSRNPGGQPPKGGTTNGTPRVPDTMTEPLVIDRFFDFWAQNDHVCAGSVMLRGSLLDQAGGQRTDLVLSGDIEYWAYLATFGRWGFLPEVLMHVDGTQIPSGNLYRKFYDRYRRCATVESWQSRIVGRLRPEDQAGFARIRGGVATWYTFAHVFAGRDAQAKRCAAKYKDDLEGKFGQLWRLGLMGGWFTWKPLCLLLRTRTRLQYAAAQRRLEQSS